MPSYRRPPRSRWGPCCGKRLQDAMPGYFEGAVILDIVKSCKISRVTTLVPQPTGHHLRVLHIMARAASPLPAPYLISSKKSSEFLEKKRWPDDRTSAKKLVEIFNQNDGKPHWTRSYVSLLFVSVHSAAEFENAATAPLRAPLQWGPWLCGNSTWNTSESEPGSACLGLFNICTCTMLNDKSSEISIYIHPL